MPNELEAVTDARSDRDRIAKSVLISLLIALGAGLLLAALHNVHFWTTSLLWAGACFAIGFLIGFLFGIPRTLQARNDDAPTQPKSNNEKNDEENALGRGFGQRVNTNLEEISDWLTKILVGLGLSEIRFVPAKLQSAATYVSAGLGGAGEEGFALSIISYFSVAGFLAGYLLTRLFLQRAFFRADVWWRQFISKIKELRDSTDELRKRTDRVSARTTRALHANSDINTALRDLDAAGENKGEAYTLLLEGHVKRLNEYRHDFPTSRPLFITMGRLYRKLGKLDDAIAVLDEFIKNKQAANERDDFLADAFYNRACYKSLKATQEPDAAAKKQLLESALEDLAQALSIAPQLKGVAGADADFIPLHPMEQFNRLTTT